MSLFPACDNQRFVIVECGFQLSVAFGDFAHRDVFAHNLAYFQTPYLSSGFFSGNLTDTIYVQLHSFRHIQSAPKVDINSFLFVLVGITPLHNRGMQREKRVVIRCNSY